VSTVADRVAAGFALYEERDPGWWREDAKPPVALSILSMGDCCRCVLGQRAGGADCYFDQCSRLFGWDEGDAAGGGPAIAHGFNGLDEDDDDALTAEWGRVISERRAGDAR
jgi:hypothetical protein